MAKSKELPFVEKVVMRPLADLIPNPKNPRIAQDEDVAALAESIKSNPRFFVARPILLSNRTGALVIIAGERRSEAAKLLGMAEVPTILLEGLTEEQEDEIMVRDNTHAGKWDEAKLRAWTHEQLDKWKAPKWSEVSEEQLAGLFAEHTPKPKPTFIVVEIPVGEDAEEVRAALETTLQAFPKCKLK